MELELYGKNQELIVYSNHDDTNLMVDNNIQAALKDLEFIQVNNDMENAGVFKLIIWHGDFPNELLFNYPAVFLKMSSQGLSDRPQILNENNILELYYYIQGGANSSRLPGDKEQWKELIKWLLDIKLKDLKEGDVAPLPSDPEIRKFIYTEPYPDALVAYYLAIVANEQKICITLSEELKKEAEEHYKQLKHGCGGKFDRYGIKALFQEMANT